MYHRAMSELRRRNLLFWPTMVACQVAMTAVCCFVVTWIECAPRYAWNLKNFDGDSLQRVESIFLVLGISGLLFGAILIRAIVRSLNRRDDRRAVSLPTPNPVTESDPD